MNALVTPALLCWPLVTLLLFRLLPARRAVIASLVIGYALLPAFGIKLPGWPGSFGKANAIALSCLLALLVLDWRRLSTFRYRLVDVPITVFCLSPFVTSLTNGLGAYDGLATAFGQVMDFGVFWFLGRLYFTNADDLRDLAWGIFIGGLICAPLALWEIRMSPHLHTIVYGGSPVPFRMFHRYGGYRPLAFMSSPLMLGMWISTACICGFALWSSKGDPPRARRLLAWSLPVLFLTSMLGKTFAAATLGVVGCLLIWLSQRYRTRLLLAGLLLAGMLYPALRASQILPAEPIAGTAEMLYEARRVASLRFRLINEDILGDHALERPWFGWGAWGRNRMIEGMNPGDIVTDGLWIIVFGKQGSVGLAAFGLAFALPVLVVLLRIPPRAWRAPRAAPVIALATVITLYWIDSLLNAFATPVTLVAMGGTAGAVSARYRIVRHAQQLPPAEGEAGRLLGARGGAGARRLGSA